MRITSKAFSEGNPIPSRHTCDGPDLSPPFAWSESPAGTESFALTCVDPDAPRGPWVHWILFNLSPEAVGIEEGVKSIARLPNGAVHGINDFRRLGYGGPCPPSGTHRYVFTLSALDTRLDLESGVSLRQIEPLVAEHLLASARLTGTYSRKP